MLLHLQKHRINRQLRQQSTRAMTMIELLVVITIIMVLTAVMIPTIRYQNRNRALREAERQLNAFIGSAQARAQQLGRPVGIWIERVDDGDTMVRANHSVSVYLAEVPLPYSGNLRNSFVKISGTGVLNFHLPIITGYDSNTGLPIYAYDTILRPTNPNNHLIKPGDSFKIQFNYRGPYYDAVRNGNNYQLSNNQRHGRLPTANVGSSSGVPYQIHRLPKKSFLPPLNLPAGAVIDLSVSGMSANQGDGRGLDGEWGVANVDDDLNDVLDDISEAGYPGSDDFCGNEFLTNTANGHRPVIIMFQPSGGIKSVIFDGNSPFRPHGWVHLLVGRQNQVFPTNQFLDEETEKGNIMDMNNRWLSINHRTGSIVSENVDSIARFIRSSSDPSTLTIFEKIAAARQLVRSGTGSEGN